MDRLEKNLLMKGIISNNNEEEEDRKHMISPVNSSSILTPINPTFHKSRVSKAKRFNSTNARYKHVANKMERDNASLMHLRKWSQGNKLRF